MEGTQKSNAYLAGTLKNFASNVYCLMNNAVFGWYQVYTVECVSKIKSILSIILYSIYGAVYPQLTQFPWDDCKNVFFILLSSSNQKYESLTHWGRGKMDAIFQTTISNGFSWMKMYEFRLKFHCLINNNIPALVQIMAWRRPGDKPLPEVMLVNSLTHICVTRPQWVNHCLGLGHEQWNTLYI